MEPLTIDGEVNSEWHWNMTQKYSILCITYNKSRIFLKDIKSINLLKQELYLCIQSSQ